MGLSKPEKNANSMLHHFKIFTTAALSVAMVLGNAQEDKPEKITNMEGSDYEFVDCKIHDALGVQNQYRSSTCWSFSSLSFLESELKRMGKKPVNLSEMYIVWYTYHHKAEQYVRRHGNFNFSAGGAFHDVIAMIKEYGIVPENAYKGNPLNGEKPMHGEMDNVLKAYLDAVIKNPNKELSPYWYAAYDKILDTYLGEIPQTFSADGNTVDPEKYAELARRRAPHRPLYKLLPAYSAQQLMRVIFAWLRLPAQCLARSIAVAFAANRREFHCSDQINGFVRYWELHERCGAYLIAQYAFAAMRSRCCPCARRW